MTYSDHAPWIRPGLHATNACLADPMDIVELMLDRANAVLDEDGPYTGADRAYLALALIADFRRSNRDLIRLADDREVFARLAVLVDRHPEWPAEAVDLVDVRSWLDDLHNFVAAQDSTVDDHAHAHWAMTLLDELDEAQLMVGEAGARGMKVEELANALSVAELEYIYHIPWFHVLNVYVQAKAQLFSSKMPDVLSHSVKKFVAHLDEIEEMELNLRRPIQKLSMEELAEFGRRLSGEQRKLKIFGRTIEIIRPVLAAAAGSSSDQLTETLAGGQSVHHCFVWRSPDQCYFAELRVPKAVLSTEDRPTALLEIRHCETLLPVAKLRGKTITCCGASAIIDENCFARFLLSDLSSHRESSMVLSVSGEIWTASQ